MRGSDEVYVEDVAPVKETKLSAEDKLLIKSLEVEAYRAQAQLHDVNQAFTNAIAALNNGLKTMAEKYDRPLKEYQLDLKTLEFVAAPRPDKSDSK